MEDERKQKLEALNKFLSICKQAKSELEMIEGIWKNMHIQQTVVEFQISESEFFYMKNETTLSTISKHYHIVGENPLDKEKVNEFNQRLETHRCKISPILKRFWNFFRKFKGYIEELERKREQIYTARTSEELKNISFATRNILKTEHILNEAKAKEHEWLAEGLKDQVENYLEELRRQVDNYRINQQLPG